MQQTDPYKEEQLELDLSEVALVDALIENPSDVLALLIVARDPGA